MSEAVISIKNLSKSYRMYESPSDKLKELMHPLKKKYHREFWALRDISFEVKKGETVGIIGRNGSGKSTLLKVLCGVLQPTAGEVKVNGRISALLELGAGFNPEFTGRDNVYMNGAIMGIDRQEMEGRFDAIADFADIGEFMDQPVKTYSSGMYVRLAFAVAISVDPDILIVDEALSVGDEAFQRKCFSRIHALQKNGTTVLFVSHSGGTIIQLCDKAILLDQGEFICLGRPKHVVSLYHKLTFASGEKASAIRKDLKTFIPENTDDREKEKKLSEEEKKETEKVSEGYFNPGLVPKNSIYSEARGALIRNPRITTLDGKVVNILVRGGEYIYSYEIHFIDPAFLVRYGMLIKSLTGIPMAGLHSHPPGIGAGIEYVEKGTVLLTKFRFRCIFLPGTYFLSTGVVGMINGIEEHLHHGDDIAMFQVQPEKDVLVGGIVDISTTPTGINFEQLK